MEHYDTALAYPVQSPGLMGNQPDIVMDDVAVHGLGLVHPKVFNFYNELDAYLASCGVDVQNMIETLGAGHGGYVSLTCSYNQALEASISRNFLDNGCISCTCHNTNGIYSAKQTAMVRASDDFYPRDPASHTIHISSVAYNTLFLGEFMQPNWDIFQAILKDISPLVMLQMESSILKGIVELFIGYIDVLERAISDETNVVKKVGSRISLAHTLSQKLSVLANSSTLVQFFSSITRSIFKGMNHINGESMEDHTMVLQQEEFDRYIFLIQEATDQLTAYFCQHFIYKIMSPEGVPKLSLEAYIGRDDSDMFQDLMPSDAF